MNNSWLRVYYKIAYTALGYKVGLHEQRGDRFFARPGFFGVLFLAWLVGVLERSFHRRRWRCRQQRWRFCHVDFRGRVRQSHSQLRGQRGRKQTATSSMATMVRMRLESIVKASFTRRDERLTRVWIGLFDVIIVRISHQSQVVAFWSLQIHKFLLPDFKDFFCNFIKNDSDLVCLISRIFLIFLDFNKKS